VNVDPLAVVAVLGALGGLSGLAAFMRAGADRSKTIVDSASTVVELLSGQLDRMQVQVSMNTASITELRSLVRNWETWALRTLDLMDRAISMVDAKQREKLEDEAEAIRQDRPGR